MEPAPTPSPEPVPTERLIEEALAIASTAEGMGKVCDALKAARSDLAERRRFSALLRQGLDDVVAGRVDTADILRAALRG